MPLSYNNKLIFIHIPKNAGTAITTALDMVDVGHHYPSRYITNFKKEWDSFLKFAVIRNPWDRLVSTYEYAKMDKSFWHSSKDNLNKHFDYDLLKNKSFIECVNILEKDPSLLRHQGWSTQSTYLKYNDEIVQDIILLKVENLKNEFKEKLSIDINIPIINSSNHINYVNYYDDSLIKRVGKIYEEDIELTNYNFK